ncbi:OmpA family protein [Metapseudomonas otitidis]|uniref:OmpA family protein n=1 Tax=Metapseudomonas otitidis TaxID=319939 RepID=UPI000D1B1C68|nr:OmpA family protein [Pseudomonas otitidis]
MRIKLLVALISVATLSGCVSTPSEFGPTYQVGKNYVANGSVEGLKVYTYGGRTLLEYTNQPTFLSITDRLGRPVAYEQIGNYYRLAAQLDSFVVKSNLFTVVSVRKRQERAGEGAAPGATFAAPESKPVIVASTTPAPVASKPVAIAAVAPIALVPAPKAVPAASAPMASKPAVVTAVAPVAQVPAPKAAPAASAPMASKPVAVAAAVPAAQVPAPKAAPVAPAPVASKPVAVAAAVPVAQVPAPKAAPAAPAPVASKPVAVAAAVPVAQVPAPKAAPAASAPMASKPAVVTAVAPVAQVPAPKAAPAASAPVASKPVAVAAAVPVAQVPAPKAAPAASVPMASKPVAVAAAVPVAQVPAPKAAPAASAPVAYKPVVVAAVETPVAIATVVRISKAQTTSLAKLLNANEAPAKVQKIKNKSVGNATLFVNFGEQETSFNPSSEVASALVAAAKVSDVVVIRSRTDADKFDLRSKALAEQRAQSARQFLVANGVQTSRIKVGAQPFGDFIVPNDTEAGKSANRRVEIELISSQIREASADAK